MLLADPAHQPTSFNNVGIAAYKAKVDDIISTVKLMKATLATFKGKNVQGKGTYREEDSVTVAELRLAFNRAVAALPEGSDKALFLGIGEKIMSSFESGKVPGAHWASFRRDAGLSVDIMNVKIKSAAR